VKVCMSSTFVCEKTETVKRKNKRIRFIIISGIF
jgi:hypothetical protein